MSRTQARADGGFPKTHKRRSYIIEGTIIEKRPEDDEDIHVVLEDALGNHIVVEFPPPRLRHRLAGVGRKRARKQLRPCRSAST